MSCQAIALSSRPVTTETYIIKTSGDQEVCVLVVSSASPEVADLLGLDVGRGEGRAGQSRGGRLQDWQRRRVGGQRLRHTGNGRDQGRQADGQRDAEEGILLL